MVKETKYPGHYDIMTSEDGFVQKKECITRNHAMKSS